MARVSRRLGRLGVDWVDETGKRRWRTFRTEADALVFLGTVLVQSNRPLSTDPSLTLGEYAPRWLAVAAVRVRPTSLVRYRRVVTRQILPGLGLEAVSRITQAQVRDWITHLITRSDKPLAKASAAQALDVLSQVFQQACDDGIARENPAKGLARKLRLTSNALGRDIKAMTATQLSTFLRTAQEHTPAWYPAYYLLAMTGVRLGEAYGLRWEDLDEQTKTLRVERQIREDGTVSEPKTHQGRRTVDVSDGLIRVIGELKARRREEALARGAPLGPWMLLTYGEDPTVEQVVQARNAIRYAMRAVLAKAKLPAHFTPHSFRHTFATIHLARGENVKWVMESLGHDKIGTTVDLYGGWMRTESRSAAAGFEALISSAGGNDED